MMSANVYTGPLADITPKQNRVCFPSLK